MSEETAKAAQPEESLPFVSSSGIVDKIQHAQELIQGLKPDTEGLHVSLRHAIEKLDEVIEQLPGWLFAPPTVDKW